MDHESADQTAADQTAAAFSLTCLANCKHERSAEPIDGVDMLQCCVCATWFHYDCVGLKEDDAVGVWPCLSCRLIPSQISLMKQEISTLLSINEALREQVTRITTLLENQSNRNSYDDDTEDEDLDEDEDEPIANGALLLGDSLLRNIKSTSDDLSVESISGARLCNMKKHLKTINPRRKRLTDLYIVCGTNDVATRKSGDKISKDFVEVIQLAKERAQNVHFSSILPRTDGKCELKKIDAVNQLLAANARDHGVSFGVHDHNFSFKIELWMNPYSIQ